MKIITRLGLIILFTAGYIFSAKAQVVTPAWGTLASDAHPKGIAIDASGNVYTANTGNNTVSKITPAGLKTDPWATLASYDYPNALAIDVSGNVLTANGNVAMTISKITPTGVKTDPWATLVSGAYPNAIAIDASGNVYTANGYNSTVSKITSAGVVTPEWARLAGAAGPAAIAIDASGNVYTANYENNTVSKITSAGVVNYAWATLASGAAPTGIAIDASGNVYTANFYNNTVSKITSAGVVTLAWATLSNAGPLAIAIDASGNVYTANYYSCTVSKITSAGVKTDPWATIAKSAGPQSIAIDASSGNLYTANDNGTVSKIVTINKWTGTTNTDWNTETNWNQLMVPTSGLDVIIPPTSNQPNIGSSPRVTTNKVTIQNGAILNISPGYTLQANGTITVNPGAAITGFYAGIVSNVTLQQGVVGQRGWRMFANPFTTTQTFASLSSTNNVTINTSAGSAGFADTRIYNNTTPGWEDAGLSTKANTVYGLFIRGIKSDIVGGGTGLTYAGGPTPFTYSVSGTLNNGDYTVASPNNPGNFSIIGNPFPAPVNSIELTNGSSAPYYLYQIAVSGDGKTMNGGWSSVLSSSTTTPMPVLGVIAWKPSTAYIIHTSGINTSNTAAANLFGADDPIQYAELQVEQNGNYQDKFYVRLDANTSVNGTDKIDLEKFYNDNVNVYSITTDKSRLAIDARNVLNTIPLGISALAGNYNFKLSNNNLPEGTTVTLTDKFLHTQTILKVGDVFPFSITTDAASHGEQRFVLSFNLKTIAVINDPVTSLTANVLGNITGGNQVAVHIAGASTPLTIAVKDMSGRSIATVNAVNGIQYIPIGNAAKGMLILQISDGKRSIIKKVIKL